MNLSQRLTKLEARHASRRSYARAFQCIVRKGREDEDRAQAFAELGMQPTEADLVICLVAVSPNPQADMSGIHPHARLIRG